MVKAKPKKTKAKDEGMSLDDAFADDEDVTYREPKPKKIKKKEEEEDEEESEKVSLDLNPIEKKIQIKASKPIAQIKKGDKIKVDGKELEVDAHYVLIDHKTTKEMAVELFDPKTDQDFQLRYFDDQADRTLDFYELDEIIYNKKPFSKIEW